MKTRHIFILLFLNLLKPDLFGHEQIVHQAITANAAVSALDVKGSPISVSGQERKWIFGSQLFFS